jgi:antitoxin ParD1/3/4
MSTRATMNISLPESLREWVEELVEKNGYGTVSEYIRQLVREDQRRRVREEIEKRLLAAIESGPATPMTKADWDRMRRELIERHAARQGKRAG